MQYVGISNFSYFWRTPLQELLLFDRVGIEGLSHMMKRLWDGPILNKTVEHKARMNKMREVFEFLIEQGIVFEFIPEASLEDIPEKWRRCLADLEAEVARTADRREKLNAEFYEKYGPDSGVDNATVLQHLWFHPERELMFMGSQAESFRKYLLIQAAYMKVDDPVLRMFPDQGKSWTGYAIECGMGRKAVQISIPQFPVPDKDAPLDLILSLRDGMTDLTYRLRQWARKFQDDQISRNELSAELRELRDGVQTEFRLSNVPHELGELKIELNLPFESVEERLGDKSAGEGAFCLGEVGVSALELERIPRGMEIAYILN